MSHAIHLHQVLLLASADAALRRDQQLASPAVRFSATAEVAADAARELHFVELEVSHSLLSGTVSHFLRIDGPSFTSHASGRLGGPSG